MHTSRLVAACIGLGIFGTAVSAGVCDYRPSQAVGGSAAASLGTASAATSAFGLAIKTAGFYTLTHSVTGATMVGSTLAGTSAAGTVGIIGGTGGAVGTVVVILTSPLAIATGVVAAAGIGIFEGGCYFQDERITEYDEVLALLSGISESADPDVFQLDVSEEGVEGALIRVTSGDGQFDEYEVRNLYIVNGVLKHRDWGVNTTIGSIYLLE